MFSIVPSIMIGHCQIFSVVVVCPPDTPKCYQPQNSVHELDVFFIPYNITIIIVSVSKKCGIGDFYALFLSALYLPGGRIQKKHEKLQKSNQELPRKMDPEESCVT